MILVTGATGNVGGAVLARLCAAGCAVRALTRDPGRARLPGDVDVVAGDLNDPATLGPALKGATGVFLMGRDGLAEQAVNLLTAAPRGEPRHVVLLSSLSVEVDTPTAAARWRLGTRRHRLAEEALRAYAETWTVLRPGSFMTNALMWSAAIRERAAAEVIFAGETEAPIHPEDIAEAAARALAEPGHAGRTYALTGPEALTPVAQVRILSEVIGREITVEPVPPDVLRERLRGRVPDDDLDAAMRPGRMPWAEPLPTGAGLLGRSLRTFRQWAAQNRHHFIG